MSRPTFMTIDLKALHHNLNRVRELAAGCSIIAMVKANAYGHGILRVAKALPKADALGVASLEEGVMLREAGVTQPIVLMEGLFYSDEIADAEKYNFTLVIHHEPHITMLEKARVKKPFNCWLKINTGMNRLGIDPSEIDTFYQRLLITKAIRQPVGLMTHFAQADAIDCAATQQQIHLFKNATKHLTGRRSLANSAAVIAWPASHGDWVRPGLMLYGASPFLNKVGSDHDLQPVMTLSSRIIAIAKVKKGSQVGYGGTWTAPEDMKVAVVGVGYGDGYPQFAKNGTPVLINETECELVGRVSMDMLTVDLRKQPNAQIGDPVILWGRGLSVERVAAHSHSTAYEILTRMTPRPKIEVKEDHSEE